MNYVKRSGNIFIGVENILEGIEKVLLVIVFQILALISYSTNYYVSFSSGNDGNAGTNENAAWRSLEKVNNFTPQPGDQILFRRGDSWVGTITVKASGTSGSPIVYGSYGSGDKPKIYSSEVISGWSLHSGNIYKAKVNKEIVQLFINEKRAQLARYPKTGYLDITTVKSTTEFSSSDLESQPQNYYQDAIWVGRTNDYYLRSINTDSSDGQSIKLSSAPSGSLGVKEGFFLCNKLEFLTQAGEWYFDAATNTVYAWMPGSDSPGNYTIRSSVEDYNVYLEEKNYVTIKDLELLHAKEHGIYINQSDYVTITNSRIINPANSGINSYYWSDHSTITGNYIYGASSFGISVYNNPGAVIHDNVIDEIGQIKNITRRPVSAWGYGIRANIGDMSIMYNRITNCGYIGISFYNGAYSIKYNYVNGACQVLDDGGGIYTYNGYDYSNAGAAGSEVVGNIVLNVHGSNDGKVADHNSGFGIYLDNATHDVLVKDNLVAGATSGIFLHQGGKNVIDGNTVMDCMLQLLISREYEPSTLINNLVYTTDRRGHPNWWGANTHQRIVFQKDASSVFDYNTYIVPYTEKDVFANKTDFTHWQTDTGQDAKSTYDGTDMKDGESEQLFYNDTKQSKTFNLGTTAYRDIYGEEVSGKLILEPFTSKILIKTTKTVQVNQSPEINEQSFNTAAPVEQNDFIGQVLANDPDADQSLNYSIIQGNWLNLFDINPTTGEIKANEDIQSTEDQTYILVVEVTDNAYAPLTASAEITINITGTNLPDLSPVYSEYLFEESNGVDVLDSESSNDGVIENDGLRIDGVNGLGLELNGSGYISFGQCFGENVQDEVSMSVWVKPGSSSSGYQGIIMHGGPNIDTYALYLYPDTKTIGFKTSGTTSAWFAIGNVDKLWDGNWHHLVAVYNGTEKIIYLDNTVIGVISARGTIDSGYGYNLLVGAGRDETNPTLLYEGLLDEVRIYNYAITSTEVGNLFHPIEQVTTQLIELEKGWNIISSYLVPTDDNIESVMKSLRIDGNLVKIQDEGGNTYEEWNLPLGWINNIGNLQQTEGYKVLVESTSNLTISGHKIKLPLDIELKMGWNIISFPIDGAIDAMQVIQPLIDAEVLDKVQDEKGNTIEYWDAQGWLNQIGNFNAGEGYMILVNQNITLTITEAKKKSSYYFTDNPVPTFFKVNYQGNGFDHMNINITGLNEGRFKEGDEIAVFDSYNCVGAIKLTEKHFNMNAVSIPASASEKSMDNGFNEGNSIELKIWSKETNEVFKLLYNINKGEMVFKMRASVFVAFNQGTPFIENIVIYPNPASSKVYIQFPSLPAEGGKICLFDITGKQLLIQETQSNIETLNVEDLPAGLYYIVVYMRDRHITNKIAII